MVGGSAGRDLANTVFRASGKFFHTTAEGISHTYADITRPLSALRPRGTEAYASLFEQPGREDGVLMRAGAKRIGEISRSMRWTDWRYFTGDTMREVAENVNPLKARRFTPNSSASALAVDDFLGGTVSVAGQMKREATFDEFLWMASQHLRSPFDGNMPGGASEIAAYLRNIPGARGFLYLGRHNPAVPPFANVVSIADEDVYYINGRNGIVAPLDKMAGEFPYCSFMPTGPGDEWL
ncbi:hypothetical protein [Actinoallomurus acaciae]|uniref:Uncharacterized protein n=1 Tax=Actinoallomurus acaciae TaxID=502577 RepID=A0ABV5YUP2_9ACTN